MTSNLAPDPIQPHSAQPTQERIAIRLSHIAEAAVRLAALGPALADLAARVKRQAEDQALSAARIAQTTDTLAASLNRAVEELRTSSGQVAEALGTVDRIAEKTRILALNAGIEAARAGEHGRAFAVVVNEVQSLSEQTASTTQLIETRVEGMGANIARVAAVSSERATRHDAPPTVGVVNHQVHAMAEAARQQLDEANSILRAGTEINALTESLLLGIGTFRFRVHEEAASAVASLISELPRYMRDRFRLESTLRSWMTDHDPFEVSYITDASGHQITDNFVRTPRGVDRERTTFGSDWSQRPWFRDAIKSDGIRASDIYRSRATQRYCFTVSSALRDASGDLVGVVGADVNVEKLLRA